MSWFLLLTLALIVFANRYFFLEPKVAIRLPHVFEQMLKYSAPCLLTAICAPIVFFNEGQFRQIPLDPYFIAAVCTIIFALFIRKILWSLAFSLLCFYTLNFALS
ncbi:MULTISPECIES: AzlD domain-containing protein [Acinetobacter]|jgi:branched-subunit amino acid transport protein|uniref:AzlD domain-containing protein n=1 Tax=Acinetobacter TaxID=469 RepID=UPI000B3C0378|nr:MULTISPECIES: AzlD domain-containing protein [Acinetobacter]AXY60637.1 AzlD domain-containing protein [Acinetobacter sp. WCHAc010052]WOE40557.1 AzlD domain-containing protein [Acinetobacter chinensis]